MMITKLGQRAVIRCLTGALFLTTLNAKFSTENLGKGFYTLLVITKVGRMWQDGKTWLKLKGFIDDNGVSLKSLANGLRNVAEEW